MNKKKKIFILLSLVLSLALSIGGAYAWFYQIKDSFIVTSGDIKIDVIKARYCFAREINGTEEIMKGDNDIEYYNLKKTELNSIPVASEEQYVIFEFVIQNMSDTKAAISLKFSNFSNYLFDGIKNYTGEDISPAIPHSNYTAKNILVFKYLKYSYCDATITENPTWTNDELKENSPVEFWNYSYGRNVIGHNDDAAFECVKLEKQNSDNDMVTIRIAMDKDLQQKSIESYYDWLLDTDSYGYKYCENLIGQGHDELIMSYLRKVKAGEQQALSDASKSTSIEGFQLTLNYFEFIGHNIPLEDSTYD